MSTKRPRRLLAKHKRLLRNKVKNPQIKNKNKKQSQQIRVITTRKTTWNYLCWTFTLWFCRRGIEGILYLIWRRARSQIIQKQKTNRVQGYGFVKFADKEVAPIAAQAMNGYLMNGKKLVVNVLSDQHPDPFKYKHGNQKLFFINWSEKAVEESNKEKSNEQIVKEVQKLLANEEEKRLKLKELGINYTFPGFKEQLKA